MDSKDRRGWLVFVVYTGVRGGVTGCFGRFAADVPRRWRGVCLALLLRIGCAFAAGELLVFLIASGIFD